MVKKITLKIFGMVELLNVLKATPCILPFKKTTAL